MFSLRKEIVRSLKCFRQSLLTIDPQADGQIENLIPVLMLNEGVDCNTAMKLAIMLVDEAAHGFHETEKHLRAQHDSAPHEEITEAFLEGCKNVVMGLTYWRYEFVFEFSH